MSSWVLEPTLEVTNLDMSSYHLRMHSMPGTKLLLKFGAKPG